MPRFAVALTSVVLSLMIATSAEAAVSTVTGDVTWTRGASVGSHWGGLWCPSARFCTVSDSDGLYRSTRPLAASGRFKRFLAGSRIEPSSFMCESPVLCLAGSRSNQIVASTHPAVGRRSFHVVGRIPQGVSNIRCHGRFCAAGSPSGFAFSATSTTPGSWVRRSAPHGLVYQVANCSAIGVCVASQGQYIWTIQQPQVRSHHWRMSVVHPRDSFDAGDCAGTGCIVPTEGGQIFANPDVTTDTWTATDVGKLLIEVISCDSQTRCYALAATRSHRGTIKNPSFLLYSDNPFDAAPVWASARIPASGSTDAADLACPSADTCVVELATFARKHHSGGTTVRTRLAVAHLAP